MRRSKQISHKEELYQLGECLQGVTVNWYADGETDDIAKLDWLIEQMEAYAKIDGNVAGIAGRTKYLLCDSWIVRDTGTKEKTGIQKIASEPDDLADDIPF